MAEAIDGQLTASIIGTDDDPVVVPLRDALALKAGRVLWNGWPTGVSVTYRPAAWRPVPGDHGSDHDLGRYRRHHPLPPAGRLPGPAEPAPPALRDDTDVARAWSMESGVTCARRG